MNHRPAGEPETRGFQADGGGSMGSRTFGWECLGLKNVMLSTAEHLYNSSEANVDFTVGRDASAALSTEGFFVFSRCIVAWPTVLAFHHFVKLNLSFKHRPYFPLMLTHSVDVTTRKKFIRRIKPVSARTSST
jgi:hypothetical protein